MPPGAPRRRPGAPAQKPDSIDALLGIRTSTDLAEEWQVSRRRAQAFIASLHKRHGVGWKIGGMWCLSAEEAETHRPADHAGRPVQ